MDLLDERKLIRRDLGSAAIGDFVLITGGLVVLDVAMLRGLWKRPSVQKLLKAAAAGAGPQPNRQGAAPGREALGREAVPGG